MEQLKVTIKPKLELSEEQCLNSSRYSVKIGDWELGKGVVDFKLEMPAGEKPKATVTFIPSLIDIDEMMAVVQTSTPND
ncbi:TPA: hypothetical protein ACGPBB_001574 [Streptococcus suis]